jgi:hypothetical protein
MLRWRIILLLAKLNPIQERAADFGCPLSQVVNRNFFTVRKSVRLLSLGKLFDEHS